MGWGFLDEVSKSLGTDGGSGGAFNEIGKGVNNLSNETSKAIGTDGSGSGVAGDIGKALGTDGSNSGLYGEAKKVADWHLDMLHKLHAPFVDTQLGRMALRAGGAFAGPWGSAVVNGGLALNDAANGRSQNNLSNLLNLGIGVYSGYNSPVGTASAASAGKGAWDAATNIGTKTAINYGMSKVPGLGTAVSLYNGVAGDPSQQGLNMVKGLGSLYFDQKTPGSVAGTSIAGTPRPLSTMFNPGTSSGNSVQNQYNINKVQRGRNWIIQGR